MLEIGDSLNRMDGRSDTATHRSIGFHKRVAYLMPETLVHEALRATRDAVEDARAGRKDLDKDAAAYFAGAIKRLAERDAVDLGISWQAEPEHAS